jgi:hypothetical protein
MRRRWPAPTIFIIALAFSLITLTPHVLSVMAAVYILSAPVAVLTRRFRRRGAPIPPPQPEIDEENDAEDPDR